MNTAIVYDQIYCSHLTGSYCLEKPERVAVIYEALSQLALNTLKPRAATEEEILLCHTKKYLEIVKRDVKEVKEQGELSTDISNETIICPKSYKVALKAVGGVFEGIDAVMTKIAKNVFCPVRPPGHHASSDIGMGYCIFNNVAIAARYAQRKYNIERVLIVDWDVHHGNGTQEIFEKDSSVFYFSTHESPLYPYTGKVDEKGRDEGLGATMNIPIDKGLKSRIDVLQAFRINLVEAMDTFQPNLIIISCGFDALESDPIGHLNLTCDDYRELTNIVKKIAAKYADGKIVSVLEGGYNLERIAEASKAHVEALMDAKMN